MARSTGARERAFNHIRIEQSERVENARRIDDVTVQFYFRELFGRLACPFHEEFRR